MNNICKFLLLCCITLKEANSARILGAFILPYYSHHTVFRAIWKELANRGHDVVVLTSYPSAEPTMSNLREIDTSFAIDSWKQKDKMLSKIQHITLRDITKVYSYMFNLMTKQHLSHPDVQKLLKNNTEKFDLVLTEWFHPSMALLGVHFKCPVIGITTFELISVYGFDMGNPINPVLNPSFLLPTWEHLSFWERLKSVEFTVWLWWYMNHVVYPETDKIAKIHIGDNLPPLSEVAKTASTIFENKNPLLSSPKANMPVIVEFSGIHVQPAKPLPKDLQEFLDDAPNGVIYFSLGTQIQLGMLSAQQKQMILDTFNELPYKVLAKYVDEDHKGVSKNVMFAEWLPQQDILSHPNVKVFITQGGLQSLEEAIYKRVPVIGIPFITDQPKNIAYIVRHGLGKTVDKSTMTKESFKKTITEIVENSKYRERVIELADLLEDEQVNSMDKIMWRIEYVMRHKNISHLQSTLRNIPTYQIFFIDVFLFVFLCLAIAIIISIYSFKIVIRAAYQRYKYKSD